MEERTNRSGIKVLCIGLARRGGMLHFHDCLAEGLAAHCTVASLTAATADHGERIALQTNIRHFFIDTGKGAVGTLSRLLAPDSWRALDRAIDAFCPDVVHITGAQEWNPFLGAILKKRNIPTVYTVHDVIHHEGVPGYFRVTEAIFRKTPSGFVVLTGESKRQLAAQGVDEAKIRVIPHGVYDFFRKNQNEAANASESAETDVLTDEPSRKEILFFGRIEPYKGLPILLDAFAPLAAAYPDWRLVIAGSGDVSAFRERLDHPQIELINRFVSDDEVETLMKRAEIVALPYLSATQSGVIPTAFPFEKAIVATAVGGIPDMIRDGETGLLVEANNAASFRIALERLMTDAELRAKLGKAGADFARTNLSWDAIAAQHVAFYQELLLSRIGLGD